MHPCKFSHRRMRREICVHQPIGDKVSIVRCVTKLTAIGEARSTASYPLRESVVFPFPHKTTLQSRRVFEGIPVVRQRPIAVAHCMAVFAHNQRTLASTVLSVFDNGIDWCIHRTHHIARRDSAGLPPCMEDSTFIMNGA